MKSALVLGAGGFIGNHLVNRLLTEGYKVRGVDLKNPDFGASAANEFVIGDLREQSVCRSVLDMPFDEVYQLAADMGGAGYLFTGENDANVMHNSATINLNIVHQAHLMRVGKIFYSSSACMYPAYNQEDPENPDCAESSAYPAQPDSEYGWEKLFSERLYLAYARCRGMQAQRSGREGCRKGREQHPQGHLTRAGGSAIPTPPCARSACGSSVAFRLKTLSVPAGQARSGCSFQSFALPPAMIDRSATEVSKPAAQGLRCITLFGRARVPGRPAASGCFSNRVTGYPE